ncbi:MAG: hypothetical protein WAN35_07345 [Terracidiphilus sp.]
MHIHGHPMSVNPADFYAASQGERAANAQRAAEVRKKLLKSGALLDGAASPEETLMISQWLDGRHSQTESAEEYHATAAGRDPDFG